MSAFAIACLDPDFALHAALNQATHYVLAENGTASNGCASRWRGTGCVLVVGPVPLRFVHIERRGDFALAPTAGGLADRLGEWR